MSEDIFSPKNYKIGGIIKASDFTMNEMEKVKKMAEALEKAKKSDSGQALEYQALAKQKKIDDDLKLVNEASLERYLKKEKEKIKKLEQENDSMPGGFLKDGTPTALTRQERAKALGFRVDEPVYHGTFEDLRKFDDSFIGTRTDEGFYGRGHYFARTPGEASYYGPNVEEYFTRGKLLDLTNDKLDTTDNFKSWATKLDKIGALDEPTKKGLASLDKIDNYIKKNVKLIKAKNDDGTEGFMARVPHPAIKGEILDSPIRGFPVDRPFPLTKEEALFDLREEIIFNAQKSPAMSQGISSVFPMENTFFVLDHFVRYGGTGPEVLTNKAIKAGYDGIKVGDETVIFDPKNIRRSDADFDPKKSELDDLLSYTPEDKKGIGSLA
tara:strand:- start:2750 stop:3895 length:1146 start_codon:yes stop_codon:yes gene_type:complete